MQSVCVHSRKKWCLDYSKNFNLTLGNLHNNACPAVAVNMAHQHISGVGKVGASYSPKLQ
jgi:hypothetical protein